MSWKVSAANYGPLGIPAVGTCLLSEAAVMLPFEFDLFKIFFQYMSLLLHLGPRLIS